MKSGNRNLDSPSRSSGVSYRAAFLAAFQKTGSTRAASVGTGVTASEHCRWLEKNAVYREDFDFAQQLITGDLRDRAVERALHGWKEPVSHRGRQIGSIRRYSDRVLIMLLKAFMPEKYR